MPDRTETEAEAAALAARNARVLQNQGLVYRVALGFKGRGIPLKDLVQSGNLGLVRAAEKFEPGRGLKFSTYAIYWIRQAIMKSIGNTSATIRVPLHARALGMHVRRVAVAAERETGAKPLISEVLDAMVEAGTTKPSHRARIARAAEVLGLSFASQLDELLAEREGVESPLSLLIAAERCEEVAAALARLPPDQSSVLSLRYGLDGTPAASRDAVASRLKMGRRQVDELERTALASLSTILEP